MPKILVTNRVHEEVVHSLEQLGSVTVNRAVDPWPRRELLRRARDADAIMAFMNDRIDAEFVASCPRLGIVACALKGADNFDLENHYCRYMAVGRAGPSDRAYSGASRRACDRARAGNQCRG